MHFFRRGFSVCKRIRRVALPLALLAALISSRGFCSVIHDAAKDGDLAKVQALLEENPELVSSIDSSGHTPLHWAAFRGHKDVAELLLAHGADVNAKANDLHTPLHAAAAGGHTEVAALLLATPGRGQCQGQHWPYALVRCGRATATRKWRSYCWPMEPRPTVRTGTAGHLCITQRIQGSMDDVELLLANRAEVNAIGLRWARRLCTLRWQAGTS
jgi:ankyrin repeat protein